MDEAGGSGRGEKVTFEMYLLVEGGTKRICKWLNGAGSQ